jgi:hypothetical protein
MPNYILRDVPPELWAGVQERAKADGWPLRPLLLALMKDYAEGTIRPTSPVPRVPITPR